MQKEITVKYPGVTARVSCDVEDNHGLITIRLKDPAKVFNGCGLELRSFFEEHFMDKLEELLADADLLV